MERNNTKALLFFVFFVTALIAGNVTEGARDMGMSSDEVYNPQNFWGGGLGPWLGLGWPFRGLGGWGGLCCGGWGWHKAGTEPKEKAGNGKFPTPDIGESGQTP